MLCSHVAAIVSDPSARPWPIIHEHILEYLQCAQEMRTTTGKQQTAAALNLALAVMKSTTVHSNCLTGIKLI